MTGTLRIAYTLEQCWHRVPGGTAVAALETLDQLAARPDLELIGVAGTHTGPPPPPWAPPIEVRALPGAGARLYGSWVTLGRPRAERATGPIDVIHSTSIIPCPGSAPQVATVHDLAFVHDPGGFTRWGNFLFRRSLTLLRRSGAIVLCSSQATADDCVVAGLPADRIRVVPLGVRPSAAPSADELVRVRKAYRLPERYVLFVGTLEPRKNLARLAAAVRLVGEGLELVAVGPTGWGDGGAGLDAVRFLGFVPTGDLSALYGGAEVVGYPSLREGFGLPVLEAMAAGAAVVTSAGTATQEAAGGAAVLVEPTSVEDIARGLTDAMRGRDRLIAAGAQRAREMTWERTAAATHAAYEEAAR